MNGDCCGGALGAHVMIRLAFPIAQRPAVNAQSCAKRSSGDSDDDDEDEEEEEEEEEEEAEGMKVPSIV